jgi:DNA invertase Pin-like site-specific DNA recombinase
VIFREKISGATAERPQLEQLMGALAAGDVVVIPAVNRLSRDTTDLQCLRHRSAHRAEPGHGEQV